MRDLTKWITKGREAVDARHNIKDCEVDAFYEGYLKRGYSFDRAIGLIYGAFYFGVAVGMQQASKLEDEEQDN